MTRVDEAGGGRRDNRIAALRKQRGLTQSELGEKIGAHWVTVSRLERGVMELTADWVEKVAAALEVHVLDLDAPESVPVVLKRIEALLVRLLERPP